MKLTLKVLFSIILLVLGSFSIFIILENNSISEVQIDFELPLPADIAAQYRVPEYPNIEKVILTGFFSDWDEDDLNYQMIPVSSDPKNHKWNINIVLPPGEHQYKFAIYVKDRSEPVWTHDLDSYKQVFNGMDSFNSLISVGSYIDIKKILQLTIYILMGVFIPLLLIYIIKSTTFKNTLVILFIILIVTNSIFTLIQREYNSQYYSFLSKSIISIIQNDYERDDSDIYMTFNLFLWYKLDKMGIKNLHSRYRYTSLLFFNEDLELKEFDYRTYENSNFINPLPHDQSIILMYPYFKEQVEQLTEKKITEVNYQVLGFEKIYNKIHGFRFSNRLENGGKILTLHSNSFLYPLIIDNKITGYLGVFFQSNNTDVINTYINFNIAIILLFIAITFMLQTVKKDIQVSDEELIKECIDRYKLTPRESDMLPYILDGLSNKEIADDLNISKRTVDNHVYNILHKTEVKNRVELVSIIKKGI